MIFRVLYFVFLYTPFLLVGIPAQFVWSRLRLAGWNILPRVFHRMGATFLGLKITVLGEPVQGRPTLIVSNHISWTDIIAIGSVADLTFVAKQEISKWFFVGFMASLQRTLYVDRNRRSDARRTTAEMARRMADGGAVLLFAEGQSDVGTHVLPFRSALVGAAQHAMEAAGARGVMIQPLTVAYTRLQGLPVGRTDRNLIAWIKGKSVGQNVREILTGGVKEVTIAFGEPRPLAHGANRKEVTRQAENEVRRMLVALNRGEQVLRRSPRRWWLRREGAAVGHRRSPPPGHSGEGRLLTFNLHDWLRSSGWTRPSPGDTVEGGLCVGVPGSMGTARRCGWGGAGCVAQAGTSGNGSRALEAMWPPCPVPAILDAVHHELAAVGAEPFAPFPSSEGFLDAGPEAVGGFISMRWATRGRPRSRGRRGRDQPPVEVQPAVGRARAPASPAAHGDGLN